MGVGVHAGTKASQRQSTRGFLDMRGLCATAERVMLTWAGDFRKHLVRMQEQLTQEQGEEKVQRQQQQGWMVAAVQHKQRLLPKRWMRKKTTSLAAAVGAAAAAEAAAAAAAAAIGNFDALLHVAEGIAFGEKATDDSVRIIAQCRQSLCVSRDHLYLQHLLLLFLFFSKDKKEEGKTENDHK